MKKTIITEVCKGGDLEEGDIFYTWEYNNKRKWKVVHKCGETELNYGIAITVGDNKYIRKSDIFIVKDIS